LGCSKEETVQLGTKSQTPTSEAALSARPINAPDIVVGAMLLPGLINSATDGVMIDLLQAITATYQGGKMTVTAAPVGRIVSDMENGVLDMSLPYLRVGDEAKLKYRYSSMSTGQVQFVLYSRKTAPLRVQDIEAALRGPAQPFPYKIESALIPWDFPTIQFTDMSSAFKKLDAGHIQGFLWAQEEADAELRKLGLKTVVRQAYGTFDDVFAIARGPRGDFVDSVISSGLKQLQSSGQLAHLYQKIHKPYDPWQAA
jgi:polar amino acid transport system substrate-binding protein